MSPKQPDRPDAREERLAKALRDNLARRKALTRARRAKNDGAGLGAAPHASGEPVHDEEPPS
jgi:hypothetical protein